MRIWLASFIVYNICDTSTMQAHIKIRNVCCEYLKYVIIYIETNYLYSLQSKLFRILPPSHHKQSIEFIEPLIPLFLQQQPLSHHQKIYRVDKLLAYFDNPYNILISQLHQSSNIYHKYLYRSLLCLFDQPY